MRSSLELPSRRSCSPEVDHGVSSFPRIGRRYDIRAIARKFHVFSSVTRRHRVVLVASRHHLTCRSIGSKSMS
eukprot:2775-Eustigmatos_ZCMA.PRE.1